MTDKDTRTEVERYLNASGTLDAFDVDKIVTKVRERGVESIDDLTPTAWNKILMDCEI